MKKIITLALSLLWGSASADVLRFSTDGTYPPFSELNSQGEMVGFDIDMGKALCEAMKRECAWSNIEFDALIPSLKAGKTDVLLASMNATEERKKSVAFTEPYYINPAVFVHAKGSKIELTPEGLKGKVIGVLRSSIFDTYVTEKFADLADIQRYNGQNEVYLDAIAGRVDVLFADQVVVHEGFLDRPEGQDFESFGEPVIDEKYLGEGIAIAVRLEDEALKNELNQALKTIRENGKYKEINDRYFKFDLSGGQAK